MSKQGMSIDDTDHDELLRIHEDYAGETDEQLSERCYAYLQSDARKYRRAAEQRSKLRVIEGGVED